jgi:hypothetical protein
VKRSTSLVLLALAAAAVLPAQAANADGASLAKHGKALRAQTAGSVPPNLVYSLSSETRSELDQLVPESGDTTKLASSKGFLGASAWSITTGRVYYDHAFGEADVNTVQEIDSVPEGGGAPTLTVQGADDLDVSQDGTTFVYSKAGQLYKAPVEGGPEVQLTGAGGLKPRFSPDGTKIVFTRIVGENFDVFTIGSDGTGLTRITAAGNFDLSGVFSPNGQRLLFTRENADGDPSVYAVDLFGKNLRRVAVDAADPDWAANGWLSYLAIDDRGLFQVAARSPGVPGTESLLTDNGLDATAVRFRSGAPAPVKQ